MRMSIQVLKSTSLQGKDFIEDKDTYRSRQRGPGRSKYS